MPKELLTNYKNLIEKQIDVLYPYKELTYALVLEASRYSLTLGGKRIRPILTLEFCRLLGGKTEMAYNFAVAIEMIHTYSLIHDDLPCMDNDNVRRGKPACHIAFGEDTALLAGDTLLTEAFYVAANSTLSHKQIADGIRILALNAGLHGMIGGQVLDLSFEKEIPTADMLVDMYSKKTSALLVSACQLGAVASGNYNDEILDKVSEYAKNLGIAFQIIDDILDYVADEELLGKPVGSDIKNNKTTFVTLLGIEKAKLLAGEYTNKALTALRSIDGDKQNLEKITNYLLNRNY